MKEEEKTIPVYKSHHKELVDLICQQTGVNAKDILDMDVYLYDMNVGFDCPFHVESDAGRPPRRVCVQRQDRQPVDDVLRADGFPEVAGDAGGGRPHGAVSVFLPSHPQRAGAVRQRGDRLDVAERRGGQQSAVSPDLAGGRRAASPGAAQVLPAVLRRRARGV